MNSPPGLAPYATASTCGARKFPEDEDQGGSCFQIDRDRILRCAAFRRLDFKTQVFVPHEHDHYRTRLTHTLEVAQVGRNIARALGLNEDLVEAVALAHDLGHPPFGHVGEAVLDKLMAGRGNFEHNRQSLRIVDYLEHPFPDFRGLNLTNIARECIARHETRYDAPDGDDFGDDALAPLEGQAVDLADEIAYTAADLEDALAAGWLGGDELGGLELWRRAWRRAARLYPRARVIHKRIQANAAVLTILAEDAVRTTRKNIHDRGIDSSAAARNAADKCVAFSPETAPQLRQLQELLHQRVYLHPQILERNVRAESTLRELFTAFIENPQLLPQRYRRRIESPGGAEDLYRVVCDYVAGMTDRFCRSELERISPDTSPQRH